MPVQTTQRLPSMPTRRTCTCTPQSIHTHTLDDIPPTPHPSAGNCRILHFIIIHALGAALTRQPWHGVYGVHGHLVPEVGIAHHTRSPAGSYRLCRSFIEVCLAAGSAQRGWLGIQLAPILAAEVSPGLVAVARHTGSVRNMPILSGISLSVNYPYVQSLCERLVRSPARQKPTITMLSCALQI
jgi:hypothetical protein